MSITGFEAWKGCLKTTIFFTLKAWLSSSSTIATQREEKNRPLFWVVDGITLCGMISKLLQLAKRETADFVSS